MKTTTVKFKGTSEDLIKAVKEAKIKARRQVEGTNILPGIPKVKINGYPYIEVSNKHVISGSETSISSNEILTGSIVYGVDSSWPSIQQLTR